MDFFELNDNLLNDMKNHPLYIFTKLHAEDKNNKVYKECLDNEVEETINVMVENMDKEFIMNLKLFYDACYIEDVDNHDEFDEETKIQIKITNRIINEVFNKICKEENND